MTRIWRIRQNNIFQEVEEFRKREFQLRNFQAVMEWLKETTKLSSLAHKNKVITDLNIKTEKDTVKIKNKNKIFRMLHLCMGMAARKCNVCMTYHFMFTERI